MYLNYLRQILYFSGVIGIVSVILAFLLPGSFITAALPFLILLFLATSLTSFYFLLRSTEKKLIKFVNVFLLTILLKLFLYTVIMVIYVLLNRSDAIPFLLSFFLLYLFYTIFETVFIIRFSQHQGK